MLLVLLLLELYLSVFLDRVIPCCHLYILCENCLLAMLKRVLHGGKVQEVKIFHDAPRLNHLFFAGGSLILMRTRECNAQELKHILEVYERVSGQVINKDKSSIMSSPNIRHQVRDRMRVDLSI